MHYCDDDPYVSSKKIKVDFELGEMETVQLAMQTYFELRLRQGEMNRVTEVFENDNPAAIQTAKFLYAERRLDWHAANKTPFNEVFDEIAAYNAKSARL